MEKTIHRANTRGKADHGWLKSFHTFSFGSYQNPERIRFGLLRVLNDDFVAPSQGFDTHPHKDMEIVSIPLRGSLEHKDSNGNEQIIHAGEVQLMSAGSGVFHSEYNASSKEEVNFLQIWILPEKKGIAPRYDQKVFEESERKNQFQTVVSPLGSEEKGVKINQQAFFSLIDLDHKKSATYSVKRKTNGIYVFLLEGELQVGEDILKKRDAIGFSQLEEVTLAALKPSKVLLIDVPVD